MSRLELIAEFTEDVQEERICEKAGCSVIIKPGNGHLIRSIKPGQPDKFVCSGCREYYNNKPTTIRVAGRAAHSSGMYLLLLSETRCNLLCRVSLVLPDPQVIRATVSAAQSRGKQMPEYHSG